LKGSIVAIVTPMLENGEVDFDSFKKLLSFHEENNTDGIVLVGTTGESATLSANEREEIFKFAVSETEIPLMAGVGSSSTKEACRLVEIAAK
jgi:4-hydroxy-tetrahydrodipicolinate synthase